MNTINQLLQLPRYIKVIILLLSDMMIAYVSSWASFLLRIDLLLVQNEFVFRLFLLSLLFIPIFYISNVYNTINRYFSLLFLKDIVIGIFLYTVILLFIIVYINIDGIPRSLAIINPIIFFILIVISRITFAYFINLYEISEKKFKIIIYGAGSLGYKALKILTASKQYQVIGFIDKDREKVGRKINGIPIYNENEIKKIVKKNNINSAVIAINKMQNNEKEKIINNLNRLRLKTWIMDINMSLNLSNEQYNLRSININDLIEKKDFQISDTYTEINNEIILVSGAGGSIGSELVKQIIYSKPKIIILIDNTEFNLYRINLEANRIINLFGFKTKIIPKLVSIEDKAGIDDIFYEFSPKQVFHAAAYKHVDLVEKNTVESFKNNIVGTKNIVDASITFNVRRFLFISTDKAVKPTTTMGKTKRFGEKLVQLRSSIHNKNKIIFSVVRFGNVLGSSGSVVPLFMEQIEKGGPITLTHKDVKRYFLTIQDAVSLVLEASQFADGGEIFLLDMGESIKIYDLAVKLINLSGKKLKDNENPDGDIEILVTGLDPIEKLDEQLLIYDKKDMTKNPSIYKVDSNLSKIENLDQCIDEMNFLAKNKDNEKLLAILDKLTI